MSAALLVTARERRALGALLKEWDLLEEGERARRTAKVARRLRASLNEERSAYPDDTGFIFAVGAAVGAPLPQMQTTLGIIDAQSPLSSVPRPDGTPFPHAPSVVAAERRRLAALRAPYWATAAVLALVLVALLPLVGLLPGAAGEPVTLAAFGPVEQPPSPDASIRRVAVSLAVTNRSSAPVFVSPLQFRTRDSENGYHRANVDATLAVESYRLLASGPGGGGAMAAATLHSGDTVAGYVVFDVPLGIRLTQIVLTAGSRELTVDVPTDRVSRADSAPAGL